MNSSKFMDKQIMDLYGSQNNDFFEVSKTREEQTDGGKMEGILPNYDFQQIRPVEESQSIHEGNNVGGVRAWNSTDLNANASEIRKYGSLDSDEAPKPSQDKRRYHYNSATMSEIDQTIKKHVDNLMHAFEGISARVSQLESRTRHFESSVDDLKVYVENNHGSSDDKLGQLENIIREVQTGLQFLRDKQETTSKLQSSKRDEQSENRNNMTHTDSVQQAASSPQQSHYLPPVSLHQPPQPLPFLPPHVPPAPPSQNPSQLPQSQPSSIPQRYSFFPPPGQQSETTQQQFQRPPPQQPQPFPQAPHQPPPQQPQPFPQAPHQPLPPTAHLPHYSQPPPSHMYELPSSRPSPGYSQAYASPIVPNFNDSYPYSRPPSQPQPAPSSLDPSGGSGYPRLPTAQILPTATNARTGSGSGGTGNKVPIDDVVDTVITMGFSRDQVWATVRKLMENGQSVDVNVVLDKLMNNGEAQPRKDWYGQ